MSKRDEDRTPRQLRRVHIDESIEVWIGAWDATDLEPTLEACASLPRRGDLTLVLGLPPGLSRDRAERALAHAARITGTLTLVASDADRLAWGALTEADLRAAACANRAARVLVEPDPKRAVVGSMQWLRPGDAFCVLWPAERGAAALEGLIALGAAWRGAWDAPDDGEFHDASRGPTELGAAAEHPTQPTPTRGELR